MSYDIAPEFDKNSLGLYIHIPFCRSKCLYCDFYSIPGARVGCDAADGYVKALCERIKAAAGDCRGRLVDTVYIGGGTPTFLSSSQHFAVLDAVAKNYNISAGAEVSIECNPATADKEKLGDLLSSGVNRLSIGLQSAHGDELKALGRIHTVADFEAIYSDARDVGFENISADVMFGIPGQSVRSFGETLDFLANLSPEHISAYDLRIEDGTPFARLRDSNSFPLPLPDEDAESEMYFSMIEKLEGLGYAQYEISNFAKGGKYSRHNMRYWKGAEYLGFGPGAHSYFGERRFSSPADINLFMSGIISDDTAYSVDRKESENEYVMLRLRLCEGIAPSHFDSYFGERSGCFEKKYGEKLKEYVALGLVKIADGRYAFTNKGFFVSNSVLSDILDFE